MNRQALLITFLAAMAIITWDEIGTHQRVPKPQSYIHVAVVWTVLGVAADLGVPELAAVFGTGLVLSMGYTYFKAPKSTGESASISNETAAAGGSGEQ